MLAGIDADRNAIDVEQFSIRVSTFKGAGVTTRAVKGNDVGLDQKDSALRPSASHLGQDMFAFNGSP